MTDKYDEIAKRLREQAIYPSVGPVHTRIVPTRLLTDAAAHIEALEARRAEVATILDRVDNIILLLTADHNSGTTYVRGFELAREYMAERNAAIDAAQGADK